MGFSFLLGIVDGPRNAEFLLFTTSEIYLGPDGAVNLRDKRHLKAMTGQTVFGL
jgi:hypothetical protein